MKLARGVALWSVAVLVTLALAATLTVAWTVRRSFPQHGGELRLAGLSAPVTVRRDTFGIPQVYAQSAADLFRAQGYLHAQDRFWEMDFRRHVTAGRVAELFGADQVETDAYLRTMGWRRVAERELPLLAPETRSYLQAYADGVNAWLDSHGGATASLEYAVLGLQNSDYEVEPWNPVDTLAWLKAMAWDLRGNMESEIRRSALLADGLSRERVESLYPAYPFDRNLPIVAEGAVVNGNFTPSVLAAPPAAGGTGGGGAATGAPIAYDAAALDRIAAGLARLPIMLGNGQGIGSNSWVIGGARTASGRPILANDPHLSPTMPGIWYQMGLHCRSSGEECPFDVAGFTFSGVPGVIIGHNARIAWGFTNLDPDVTDLYLERVDGDQVQVGDQWEPLQTRQETLKVAGGDDVTIKVRSSRHGPLLSDASEELRDLATSPRVTGEKRGHAIALRWTALDPGRTADAIFMLNRAGGWGAFRAAAATFDVPAQNLVYADVDGNIGYQAPGRIPVRGNGDGRWMAPGWDSSYDWKGFIPFRALPSVLNPARGYVVTANQAVIGPQYTPFLTRDWSYGYRSQRIHAMISDASDASDASAGSAAGKITVEDVQRMQFDSRNGFAPTLVPALLAAPGGSPRVDRARDLLPAWDFQQPADGATGSAQAHSSAAAAFYNATWRHLLLRLFDELPTEHGADGGDRWFEVVRRLLAVPVDGWWDNGSTPRKETRDDILAWAMRDAVDELSAYGPPADWRWGALHTLTVRNQTFGTSGIAPIEWLFNGSEAGVPGGDAIVNATGWTASEGYEVDAVPSMRMIVDMSNLDGSRWIQLTGNSGHAFHPNYTDQFELWRTGRTLPMRWDRDTIESETAHTLTLNP